jgi:hypothetical protein
MSSPAAIASAQRTRARPETGYLAVQTGAKAANEKPSVCTTLRNLQFGGGACEDAVARRLRLGRRRSCGTHH